MKGWIQLNREKLAAQERARLDNEEKQRRRHVQNYLRGFFGFCIRCGIVLRGDHLKTCKRGPNGEPRRLLITSWEATDVIVTVNGKKYQTSNTGWTRRTVRGTDMFTKTVGDGAIAVLHRLEAAQAGVVMERDGLDATSALPSATSTVNYKPMHKPRPVPAKAAPKPKVLDLSEWDVGTQIQKEAARMSALADKREALRKKHVTKYKNAHSK